MYSYVVKNWLKKLKYFFLILKIFLPKFIKNSINLKNLNISLTVFCKQTNNNNEII